MKFKKILAIPLLIGTATIANAADYVVCDFEDCEIGQKFTIWNNYGGSSTTTAVVEVDPKNSKNKVLHVTNHSWNDHVEFTLPEKYAGTKFSDAFEKVTATIYRHPNDPCGEWKNFQIWLGDERLYAEDFPSYGSVATWRTWNYTLAPVSESNTSAKFRLGFNSENSDYYIDDIRLTGTDFVTFEDGELNFSDPNSTSSSYTNYNTPINIPAGTHLNVYTSRYTYWMSPVKGAGQLNIYAGGERSNIGTSGDLSSRIGTVSPVKSTSIPGLKSIPR